MWSKISLTSLMLAFLAALGPTVSAKSRRSNSILLSQVKTLTLRNGELSSHRRVEPLPQLACVGGNARGLYDVDIMRCKNAGSEYDAEDVQWTCSASLPPEFKLGSTDVICEGYDSPDDPYMLKGSCGVEYRLVLTEAGEQKYGSNAFERVYRQPSRQSVTEASFTVLFWGCFAAVICIFIYKTCIAPTNHRRRPGNDRYLGWNGGGGGGDDDGGDDGHDALPPPYTPIAPKPKSEYQADQGQSSTDGQRRDGTWRPGFWTGAAAGAAASYAGSALNNMRNPARPNRNRAYEYGPQQPEAGPSNWFGRAQQPSPPRRYGGGGGGGSSMFGGESSSSTPAPSSSRYESTGFGSTRRR